MKFGWGSDLWRSVKGLAAEEKRILRDTDDAVWFSFEPFHYTQSGYKIVYAIRGFFDCREPKGEELMHIKNAENAECPACDSINLNEDGSRCWDCEASGYTSDW